MARNNKPQKHSRDWNSFDHAAFFPLVTSFMCSYESTDTALNILLALRWSEKIKAVRYFFEGREKPTLSAPQISTTSDSSTTVTRKLVVCMSSFSMGPTALSLHPVSKNPPPPPKKNPYQRFYGSISLRYKTFTFQDVHCEILKMSLKKLKWLNSVYICVHYIYIITSFKTENQNHFK